MENYNFKSRLASTLNSIENYSTSNLEELKRKGSLEEALELLIRNKTTPLHFASNTKKTFKLLKSKIPTEVWEKPLVRRLCSAFFHSRDTLESCISYIQKSTQPKPPTDYKLHEAVFSRELCRIRQLCIGEDPYCFYIDIDEEDPSGNTPLMLAVKLRYYEEVLVLLDHGADPKFRRTQSSACPLEQAAGMRDKPLVRMLVSAYFTKLHSEWQRHISELSKALKQLPNFQLELVWKCKSSFIPFVSRYTPSDKYLIYKKGDNLRVDLTLVGWDKYKPKRGNVSLVFRGKEERLVIVDHDSNQVRDFAGDLNMQQVEAQTQVSLI